MTSGTKYGPLVTDPKKPPPFPVHSMTPATCCWRPPLEMPTRAFAASNLAAKLSNSPGTKKENRCEHKQEQECPFNEISRVATTYRQYLPIPRDWIRLDNQTIEEWQRALAVDLHLDNPDRMDTFHTTKDPSLVALLTLQLSP